MLHAFKKNPNLRIPSVGALADAFRRRLRTERGIPAMGRHAASRDRAQIAAGLPNCSRPKGGRRAPEAMPRTTSSAKASLGTLGDPFAAGALRQLAAAAAPAHMRRTWASPRPIRWRRFLIRRRPSPVPRLFQRRVFGRPRGVPKSRPWGGSCRDHRRRTLASASTFALIALG